MNLQKQILDLVQQALEDIESNGTHLSTVIRKATRIARLRNDFDNLWWLEWEMLSLDDQEARHELGAELISHYTKSTFEYLNDKYLKLFTEERSVRQITIKNNSVRLVDKGNCISLMVPELENSIRTFEEAIKDTVKDLGVEYIPKGLVSLFELDSAGLTKYQMRSIYSLTVSQIQAVLVKICQRLHRFLSATEKQIVYGQIQSDIFERNREFVDFKLRELCPDALEKFVVAYRRLGEFERDSEAGSQALMSCRRILKSLADALYPARKDLVVGADGKKRTLNDKMFVARLWQYVWEKTRKKTSGKLLLAQLEDTGNRIDRLNDLSSKGVHHQVSKIEADQCVIQTYLLCGDILRLSDN